MPNYHRVWLPGGTFFFTLVTNQRKPIFQDQYARDALSDAMEYAKDRGDNFQMDAVCLLPDHLHCIWTLPEGDTGYPTRWKMIKARFSRIYRNLGGAESVISVSRMSKGDSGVWQRRYWEHTIRDKTDLIRHIEYIHYNPVKHGYVRQVKEWPWSSFHQFVRNGQYPVDWGSKYVSGDGLEIAE